jgi:adenosylcobinamide kinase/adenosylcobinamide-phosphate guanylyltransferase
MSRRLILLLGGARSGKSTCAERLAAQSGDRVLYVATAQAGDGEMEARIAVHRQARTPTWQTVESPTGVGEAIRAALASEPMDAVLLDCLTLLVSNVILQGVAEEEEEELDRVNEVAAQERVAAELDGLLDAFHASNVPWIVVSNEVGWGVVPPYPLGRVYRDLLGWANQRLAAEADQVYLMVAGLPLDIKALSATAVGSLNQRSLCQPPVRQ